MRDRFWSKVDKNGPGGCWLWTGATSSGYGRFRINTHWPSARAHRLAYESVIGPIPNGLTLDHLCRVRRCVNPHHMEPVSRKLNILRGDSCCARNAKATHCPHGHPYDLFNTYDRGERGRECRTCRNEHMRRWRAARQRGLAAIAEAEKA